MIQNIRLLKAVVIVLGLGIVVGLGVLLVALGQRAADRAGPADAPFTGAEGLARIQLPAGATVLESDLDGGRLLLRLRLANGVQELAIHDLATGARLGAAALGP